MFKRVVDIGLALSMIALLGPVMVAVAIMVRLSSPGPVIFRHERVGLNGRLFHVYKFRSMRAGVSLSPEQVSQFSQSYKLSNDPRVTAVGRWLRRLSLDEAPQLFNVLGGSMSIVGPRPVTAHELQSKYGSAADELLSMKPGLTGLWQVSGRSALTYEERVALDLRYVRESGTRLDLAIIARTPLAVLLMRGAE